MFLFSAYGFLILFLYFYMFSYTLSITFVSLVLLFLLYFFYTKTKCKFQTKSCNVVTFYFLCFYEFNDTHEGGKNYTFIFFTFLDYVRRTRFNRSSTRGSIDSINLFILLTFFNFIQLMRQQTDLRRFLDEFERARNSRC